MHAVFVSPDPRHTYTAATPPAPPLPGSESAQVYLALALAAAGHQITLITGTPTVHSHAGVTTRPLAQAVPTLKEADVVLVTNNPRIACETRDHVRRTVPVVAWQHNFWRACGPDAALLRDRFTGPRDRVLCVSAWHRTDHIRAGGLEAARVDVLPNAIAPVFEGLFSETPVVAHKAWPPRLAFTSVPYKGLEPALDLFEQLRGRRPELSLLLFSSFDFYPPGNSQKADPRWAALSERAARTPGVLSLGNVPQATLARALKSTLALFYPSILPETSSIAVMEAMAAGCVVVTTRLGALPETLAGHGVLADGDDRGFSADDFLNRTLGVVETFSGTPERLEPALADQVAYANRTLTWASRARAFEQLVDAWRAGD